MRIVVPGSTSVVCEASRLDLSRRGCGSSASRPQLPRATIRDVVAKFRATRRLRGRHPGEEIKRDRTNLAEELPDRHARGYQRRSVQLGAGRAGNACGQVRRQTRLSQSRLFDELYGARAEVARLRGLPAGAARHGEGRASRDHVAKPSAIPGRAVRRAARRHDRRQRQSDVHAARTRAPAEGLWCCGDCHPRELRRHAAEGAARARRSGTSSRRRSGISCRRRSAGLSISSSGT